MRSSYAKQFVTTTRAYDIHRKLIVLCLYDETRIAFDSTDCRVRNEATATGVSCDATGWRPSNSLLGVTPEGPE